jgi:DNA-binding LytR/AlgR family response regulator
MNSEYQLLDPEATARAARKGKRLGYFFVRHDGRHLKIVTREILHIESRRNYSLITTRTGAVLALITLKRLEELLSPEEFCRIHRAYIVSLDWINSFDNTTVYGKDQMLPIGETYRRELLNRVTVVGEQTRRKVPLRNEIHD